MRPSYHLDTSYLFHLLAPEKRDEARVARDSLSKLRGRGYTLRISDVAMGELVKLGVKKGLPLERLPNVLDRERIEVYSLKREEVNEFINIVNHLRSRHLEGEELHPPDCLIVAYSMTDRESRGLLTFDRNLIENRRIPEIKRLKRRKFEVTDHVE